MANANSSELPQAVVYLRMSDDSQTESVPAQRVELTKYAKARGYSILREYVDEAISGDATERRSGFLAMREAVSSGEFDLILAWDQDRFGRFDPLDAGYWIYPFRRAGVRLETIAQGRIDWEDLTGQLVYSVNQLGKAQFLRDLSRNTTRGLLNSARAGTAGTGGPNPYGYRSRDGNVWIVEEEAKIVRWIFAEYLKARSSLRSIAADLNRRNVRSPNGKNWRSTSIRVILQRRKYTGTFVYGARNGGKYFAMRDGEIVPRRKADKFAPAEPIIHEGKFEAITDRATFDRVQRKLAGNKSNTAPRSARQYLLSGLLKCGDCNGALGGRAKSKQVRYVCVSYHATGRAACYCNSISEGPLVEVIRRKIQERYTTPAALDRLRRALTEEQGRDRPRPRDLARLRREIELLDQKINNAENTVLEAPPEIRAGLYRKLQNLTADRDRLRSELANHEAQQRAPGRRDRSEVDRAIDALRSLGAALSKAPPEETRELLSSFVSKIVLHFKHEESKAGRKTSVFSHGEIFLRPDAGEGRGAQPDAGGSSLLNTKGPFARPTHQEIRKKSVGVFRRRGDI